VNIEIEELVTNSISQHNQDEELGREENKEEHYGLDEKTPI
jgi:hypothetical protein